MLAAAGTKVDDPVGTRDEVEAVLDDHHSVPRLEQAAQCLMKKIDVTHMESGRRLVEDEKTGF